MTTATVLSSEGARLLGSITGIAADRNLDAARVLEQTVQGWVDSGDLTPQRRQAADEVRAVLASHADPSRVLSRSIPDARDPLMLRAARILWDGYSYPDDRSRLEALREFFTGYGYGRHQMGTLR